MSVFGQSSSAEDSSRGRDASGENRDSSTWVPYEPPPRRNSFAGWLRRYAFSIALTLSVAGLGALLYYAPQPDYPRPSLGSGNARLSIYSEPGNASVIIGGDTVGITPILDHSVRPGMHRVSVVKTNHSAHDTVMTLRSSQSTSYTAQLSPLYTQSSPGPAATQDSLIGSVSQSDPPPDVPQEETPDPPSATENVSETVQESGLDVEPPTDDTTTSLEWGTLELRADPENTTVELNGQPAGSTPLRIDEVPVGTQDVTFSRAGYEPVTRQVEVEANESVTVEVSLVRRTGHLRILVQPWGSISIEGEVRAQDSDVWYETELPVGTYEVTASHPSLGQQARSVEVAASDTQSVVFEMREQ